MAMALTSAPGLHSLTLGSPVSWTLSEHDIAQELFVDPTNSQLGEDDVESMSDLDSSSGSDSNGSCSTPTIHGATEKALATSNTSSPPSTISAVVSGPWPPGGRPPRRKRKRMSEDERKVRHREVQREFMKRKRARIAVLRKVVSGVEKQLKLVTILQEIETLKEENDALSKKYETIENSSSRPATPCFTDENGEKLVFSLPKEDDNSMVMMITDFEWDEIFNVLSHGNGDVDVAVDCDLSVQK